MGLQIGSNFFFHSGRPINSLTVHPTDYQASLYGAFSFFLPDDKPAGRGSMGTTPSIWGLDLMTKYDFQVGSINMNVRLDIFNIFDNSDTTEVDEFGEDAGGFINTNYLATTRYQAPRRVRLGFGLVF